MTRVFVTEGVGFQKHRFTDVTNTPLPTVISVRTKIKATTCGPTRRVLNPYRLPTTAQILATSRAGPCAVGTFSGCGGSSLGLTWSGIHVLRAYEFDPLAAASYRANFATPVDTADIRTLDAGTVLRAIGMATGELDIVEGSPPCSKFSMVGKRERGWGQTTASDSANIQQVNVEDLFFDWVRLVEGIQPRVAVAENVHGLAIGKAKGMLRLIYRAFQDAGYRVQVWDLNAQWLGVPQSRRRLIFVGVRNDVPGFPAKPVPHPHRFTVSDALPYLQDGPIPPRMMTIPELKRLCGFPDDFQLVGSEAQQWRRLGNAVMPPMYKAVGDSLVAFLTGSSAATAD